MTKIMKKALLSLMLVVSMVIALAPQNLVMAASTQTLDTIYLNDLKLPELGKLADASVTFPKGAHYRLAEPSESNFIGDANCWVDKSGDASLEITDTFENSEPGNYFSMHIIIADEGYVFDKNTKVYINGSETLVDPDATFRFNDNMMIVYSMDLTAEDKIERTIEIPFSIQIDNKGTLLPKTASFKFEASNYDDSKKFQFVDNTVEFTNLKFENNKETVQGKLKVKTTSENELLLLSDGFKLKMLPGKEDGWTYATEEWLVIPDMFNGNDVQPLKMEPILNFTSTSYPIVKGEISEAPAPVSFNVSYNKNKAVVKPEEKPKADVVPTGDMTNITLWASMLAVAGIAMTVTMKRKNEN